MLLWQVQLDQLVLWWRVGGLDDFVGQVVAERCGNGQGLHLLSGHHPAESHPAHVLKTGNATRTLPEVHATITSPRTKIMTNQTGGGSITLSNSQDCTGTL